MPSSSTYSPITGRRMLPPSSNAGRTIPCTGALSSCRGRASRLHPRTTTQLVCRSPGLGVEVSCAGYRSVMSECLARRYNRSASRFCRSKACQCRRRRVRRSRPRAAGDRRPTAPPWASRRSHCTVQPSPRTGSIGVFMLAFSAAPAGSRWICRDGAPRTHDLAWLITIVRRRSRSFHAEIVSSVEVQVSADRQNCSVV